MVSSLIDQHAGRFAAVEYHTQYDGYHTDWGQERLDLFYAGWCGATIPVMVYDGVWFWEPEDYVSGLEDRLDVETDVTIDLTGRQLGPLEWQVDARVCIEAGGEGKRMVMYAVQTLDRWPASPSYSRRTFKQAAPTETINLAAGACTDVSWTFEFDVESANALEDIGIAAWAQEVAFAAPADVYQAAQMDWPFPQGGGGPMEPEMPRQLQLELPLFSGTPSAWLEDARPAPVVSGSQDQIETTYRALCGDTTGLYPVGDPPTSSDPAPRVAVDEGSLPIFAAGSGQQEVLLCGYDGHVSYPNSKWGVTTEGGPVEVPSCAGQVRPSGPAGLDSDGWLVLFDAPSGTAYDFWQATTARQAPCLSSGAGVAGDEILEAGRADFFDVDGTGANPARVSSARASGTPLLAGAILPEDVAAGQIAHALAVAIPGLRNLAPDPSSPLASDVVYPASSTDGERYSINPDALAAGQRLRLRSALVDDAGNPVTEAGLAPITRMFLQAARRYGAYVVDTADGFTFVAEDLHTAVLDLDDDAINSLIGEPAGTPLAEDKTRWQIVIEALNAELAGIPFAAGPCAGVASEVETSNWVVVEGAEGPPQSMPAPRHPRRRFQAQMP